MHDWSLTWVHIYMTGDLPGLATLIHDWSLTWVGYTYMTGHLPGYTYA